MYRHSIAAVVRAVGVGKWGASVTVVMALIPLCANASPVKFECSYTQYSDASGAHPASEPFKITYIMDGMKGNIL